MSTPAVHLADIIDTRTQQPPVWIAYPGSETFQVLIRPLGNRQQEFIDTAQRIDWDLATMSKIVMVDQEQYLRLFCEWVIVGWQGLTITDLRRLVLLEDPKRFRGVSGEIGCDEAAKLLLMQHSPAFNAWINRKTRDIERFNLEREDALKKKSSKPSASSSTSRESTAASARTISKQTGLNPNVKTVRSGHGTRKPKRSWPCMIFPAPGESLSMTFLRQRLMTLKSLFTNGPGSGDSYWPCTAV